MNKRIEIVFTKTSKLQRNVYIEIRTNSRHNDHLKNAMLIMKKI